jgi:hypothetical protein
MAAIGQVRGNVVTVPATGEFAYQVDGTSFSEEIAFEARIGA